MEMASTDKGRAKPKLLYGTYQKFVAASVGEILYIVLLALKNANGQERLSGVCKRGYKAVHCYNKKAYM